MKIPLIFIVVVFISITKVSGQTMSASEAYSAPLATYEAVMAGITLDNHLTVVTNFEGGMNIPAGWTLKVRANGNFTNGINTIPLQYVSLKFRGVEGIQGVSGSQVPLTNDDVNLISTTGAITSPPAYYVPFKFDMIVQGGAHLMVPTPGTYRTTLTISLCNSAGAPITSLYSVPLSFTINYDNTCSGTTIGNIYSTSYNFDAYSKLQTGATVTEGITIPYSSNGTNCRGWSLKVKANGNFVNGSSSVPVQNVSLRFNRVPDGSSTNAQIGASSNPIALSMSDVILINQSNAPFGYSVAHTFDMIIAGGGALSAATTQGTYSCPLIFTLYNQNGQLISTKNVSVSFQITYANSTSYTLTLFDPSVSFGYSSISNYLNGMSVAKKNGLKIVGYTAYQVIVKTVGPNLINGANTLPVSIIKLQNASSTNKPGITSTNVSLSANDQVIIVNNLTDHTYQTVEYNLEYLIEANSAITTAPSGTYTTQVVFVILPK
ncbi:hypothetical protein ADIARSV_3065 [Arcticibacter svalbardensis MN12-7]|uniref:Uncharacterized protein n=1 Tax=Arcticibacter svalbardensis MN12-7 TaxID=1150600 RepID=R9GQC9_9SPHI|nr:hypothetical protein [Arcticibacter svalbardensis]EOR93725.1 hypothetical protein ADIARSV_3065 [Arcticibacter svalbardensis MN12-7]